jgi:hypothetical protein
MHLPCVGVPEYTYRTVQSIFSSSAATLLRHDAICLQGNKHKPTLLSRGQTRVEAGDIVCP